MDSVFNLVWNDTGLAQIFYTRKNEPRTVETNCVIDSTELRGAGFLKPIRNFVAEAEKRGIKRFYFHRTVAIGDILMLVPVVRYLRRFGYDAYIRTSVVFKPALEALDVEVQALEQIRNTNDFGIVLDGTVERDHVTEKLQQYHRVHIYMKILGLAKYPKSLDWSCDLSRFDSVEDEFLERPFVIFQGAGSTYRKTLPVNTVCFLLNKLNTEGIRVVYVGSEPLQIPTNKIDLEYTKLFFDQLTISQLFSLIGKSACVLNMDSAPLWISHFTKTPTITFLGPTRTKERLSLHPLYPEGAVPIELNTMIGCESCFELSSKCNHNISCLKQDPQVIYKLLEPVVNRFWSTVC